MRHVTHFTLIVMLALAGAAAASAAERVELTKDPSIMFKPTFRSRAVTVYGVGIGDDAKSIPADQIRGGVPLSLNLKSGIRVDIDEKGKVESITADEEVVKKWGLKLASAADIAAKFGKHDDTANSYDIRGKVTATEYLYRERGLGVFITFPDQVGVTFK